MTKTSKNINFKNASEKKLLIKVAKGDRFTEGMATPMLEMK
jgi:hypothetical protein